MYLVTEIQTLIISKKVDKKPDYIIYCLKDYEDKIRYIGSTSGPLLARIKQHRQAAKNGNTELYKWIRDEMNLEPRVEIITYAESKLQMLMVESHLINTTEHLLNIHKKG